MISYAGYAAALIYGAYRLRSGLPQYGVLSGSICFSGLDAFNKCGYNKDGI